MQTKTYNEILSYINQFEFLIIDQKILDLYPEITTIVVTKKFYAINGPEESKTMAEYEKICQYFLGEKISRKSSLLAIGGGATSDLAGFVAATVLRGISWEVIPTTLLAMIDASIGGKVGINTTFGKNLIGSFHQPESISICFDFLKTLSDNERKSGQGELLKYTFLSKEISNEFSNNGYSDEIILLCAKYKSDIVENDLKEAGDRKILNLGHTFGHAIEKSLNISHGIAVYYGLLLVLELYATDLTFQFYEIMKKNNITFDKLKKMDFNTFSKFLSSDKKRISKSEIEFLIPKSIGQIEIQSKDMETVLVELKEHKLYKEFFNP